MFAISFETKLVLMEQMVLLPLQVPLGDVDRIIEEVVEVVRLTIVKFDSNAYQGVTGVERNRRLEGAAAGPETELRQHPGIVEGTFELPDKQNTIG